MPEISLSGWTPNRAATVRNRAFVSWNIGGYLQGKDIATVVPRPDLFMTANRQDKHPLEFF